MKTERKKETRRATEAKRDETRNTVGRVDLLEERGKQETTQASAPTSTCTPSSGRFQIVRELDGWGGGGGRVDSERDDAFGVEGRGCDDLEIGRGRGREGR